MRDSTKLAILAVSIATMLFGSPATVQAATPPTVYSVIEGRDAETDRPVLVLIGKGLTKFSAFRLEDPAEVLDAVDLSMVLEESAMLVLGVPAEVPPGEYDLVGTYGDGETLTFQVCVEDGAPLPGSVIGTSLEAGLRSDLDDAETLGGDAPAFYRNATNIDAGTLSPSRFSAYGDLVAEAKVGASADQLAAGNHGHDAVYAKIADLAAAGTVNDSGNPVDWTRLKNVPADFADGTDVGMAYAAGTGLSLAGTTFSVDTVGWGQLTGLPSGFADGTDADTTYAAGSGLSLAGTTFSVSSVGWGQLTGVPSGFADGVDNNTTYSAGSGLSLAGTTFSVSSVGWGQLTGVPSGFADGTDDNSWNEASGNVYRSSGKVGIGTFSPTASLHVVGNDGALFIGNIGVGAIPTTGSGTRMMWYPKRAAFRAGQVIGSKWDDALVGSYSVATGLDTTASGTGSMAMGQQTTASGYFSTAMGYSTLASGHSSTAMGATTTASGYTSTAMGATTTASGDSSTAMGSSTTASGHTSTAMGDSNWAIGNSSTAMGHFTEAIGQNSTAMGESTTAQAYGSLVLGRFNVIAGNQGAWSSADPVLVVGKGTADASRSNALTLLKNGNLTIAGTLTENSDARLKKDIAPLTGALGKLAGIRGVSYRFKDEEKGPSEPQVGLLAQEVREAFPELVQEDSEGTLSVAYGKFTAVLVEAVREQQAVIDSKTKEIEALERRLARVEALLEGKFGSSGDAPR